MEFKKLFALSILAFLGFAVVSLENGSGYLVSSKDQAFHMGDYKGVESSQDVTPDASRDTLPAFMVAICRTDGWGYRSYCL